MTAVKELHMISRDDLVTWGSKRLQRLIPGRDRDQIAGLTMSLNEHTGIISCDAPGRSIGVHISRCSLVLNPAIPLSEPIAAQTTAQPARDTSDEAGDDSEEPTYADDEEISDAEVARLVQGPVAKQAIAARVKKKPGPKPKVKPSTIEDMV